jgi:peptidoglycan/LPS O-acetylase OafA/YrhL
MTHLQVEANRPKSLNALISLRFFAAFVIVIHHSKSVTGMDFKWLMQLQTYQPVSFFFVLSGFVLAYVYPSLKDMREVSRFLIARFSRLWPLHVFTFLLLIVIFPSNLRNLGGDDSIWLVLLNLCMLQSWIPIWNYYFSYNSLSWAISTEFAFYLFFPWLIHAWKRTWGVKLLCTFLMVAAIVWYANITGMPSGEIAGTTDQIGYLGLVYTCPFGRVFEFTLGMALALLYSRLKTRWTCSKSMGNIIEAAALIMAFGIMIVSEFLANFISWMCPWVGESGRYWLLDAGLPSGFYGLLILVMALENGMISKFLSQKILMRLGEMSLSIFVLHQILVRY